MFGKKVPTESLPEISLNKIPDDFYGGKNPIVKFKTVEKTVQPKEIKPTILSNSEKKLFDQQTAVGAGKKMHPVNLLANSKFLLLVFLVMLVLVGVVGGGYYFWQYQKSKKISTPVPPANIVVDQTPSPTVTESNQINNAPVSENNPSASLVEAPLDLPSNLIGDSVDTDKDGLTDVAEELFSTDASLPDTDSDSYTDGSEIYHLYNPKGKEPMKLVDSGLVQIYTNPIFGYKLYYPKSWAVGNVDSGYKDILFSTITGENIEVRAVGRNAGESFSDWFSRFATAENYADYTPVESVFKQPGFGRKDNLVYFLPADNQVFVIIYRTSNSSVANYRVVNQLFMKSFQFGNSSDVPPRIIEENPSVNGQSLSTSSQATVSTGTNQ